MKKYFLPKIRSIKSILKNKNVNLVIFGLLGISIIIFLGIQFSKFIADKKDEWNKYAWHLNRARNTHIVFNQDEKFEIMGSQEDDYEGIGIIFKINLDVVFVSEIVKNSPADKAGLEVGDKIIKIDDKYTLGMIVEEISTALKGRKGTKVRLNIYRDSFGDKSKDFVVTRDLIDNSERREYFSFFRGGQGGKDLGNNYRLYKNKIYYWDDGGGQAVPGMVFINVNPDTFVSLENKNCTWDESKSKFNPCRNYARDNSKVFYAWFEIKDADPATFQIMKGSFAKDKNYVFYDTQKIEGVDTETFQIIGLGRYGKDKNIVVYADNEVVGADPQTFLVLHEKYCLAYDNALAKDKNSYYFRDLKITKDQYLEHLKSDNNLSERIKETCN